MTPVNQESELPLGLQSTHGTHSSGLESVAPDKNGKCKRAQVHPRKKWRKGEHQIMVHMAVHQWREQTWQREFPGGCFPVEVIMSDSVLSKIVKDPGLTTVETLGEVWTGSQRFGSKLLEIISPIDRSYFLQIEQAQVTKWWRKASRLAARKGKQHMAMLEHEAKKARKPAHHGRHNRRGDSIGDGLSQTPLRNMDSLLNLPGMGVFKLKEELSPYIPRNLQGNGIENIPPFSPLMNTPVHGILLEPHHEYHSGWDNDMPLTSSQGSSHDTRPPRKLQRMDSNPFLTPSGPSPSQSFVVCH